MESIVVLEKPTPRVALSDWQGKVRDLRETCDTRRLDALNLRSESKRLRSETDFQTNLDTYHNNNRIADRLTELENWKEKFTLIVEEIDKELANMTHEKCLTENLIEFLSQNLTMVNGCLNHRDTRGGADLYTDSTELEIKRELKLLNSLKAMLTKKCQTAWEQINELRELRCKLILDLEDKNISIAIDTDNLDLDRFGANIRGKSDATRYPSSMISYEAWHEHCNLMKLISDSTLEDSQKIRESINVPRLRAQNDLKAQNDATNFALRKRIHETQKIKNELNWQRSDTMKDMEELRMEIDDLEKNLENTTNALKLAETRGENRVNRPGKELYREDVVSIEEEKVQLRETKNTLKSKIDLAKATYKGLDEQLVVVDKELLKNNQLLTSDLRCLDVRNILSRDKDKEPDTQTD